LKLQRTGSQIQASRSSDGTNWTVIGTQTISMQAAIYVGLAVTSHNPDALASAAFIGVVAGTGAPTSPAPGPVNQPPVITMSNPTSGATFTAPATVAFSANASDSDGTVTRVEFYAGPNMVGAVTSAPYSYNWTSVPAGTYTVYALARDNSGNVTSTAQRTVTVRGNTPSTAIFTPSSNDSVAVTYYSIEFFPSATSPKAGAGVASQNLGKPTMINGQAQVNVSATIQSLQPGTYVGMVTAYGPSGSASSQPSLPFVR
jgi:chitinase